MGFLDFLLTSQQKKEKLAIKIGLESGLFIECPVCRDVTEAQNQSDVQEKIGEIAEKFISSSDEVVESFHGDVDELHNVIVSAAKKMPYHCMCENS